MMYQHAYNLYFLYFSAINNLNFEFVPMEHISLPLLMEFSFVQTNMM